MAKKKEEAPPQVPPQEPLPTLGHVLAELAGAGKIGVPVVLAADPEGNDFRPFGRAELIPTPDALRLPRSAPRPERVVVLWPQ